MQSRDSLVLAVCLALAAPARAVFVNEVMANPGTLDWNQDGSPSVDDDEYVELLNPAAQQVDISGWTLSDGAQLRHVFEPGTVVASGGSIVVFGGGTPLAIPGLVTTASTSSLGLSNTGDTIQLDNGVFIEDSVIFGPPTAGVSFNRDPDATREAGFALHGSVLGASGGGSPGRRADQSEFAPLPLALPFINEWLPNPNSLANDWNGDLLGDDAHDEFVEIVNPENGLTADLSGWTLSDFALVRHVFAAGTILVPSASIVVIANGTPFNIPGLAVAASSGALGINNSGTEILSLMDGDGVVSSVSHVSQTADVSWNRDPDGEPNTSLFALHTGLSPTMLLSSPGMRVDGTPFAAPEPGGAPLVALAALWLRKRRIG